MRRLNVQSVHSQVGQFIPSRIQKLSSDQYQRQEVQSNEGDRESDPKSEIIFRFNRRSQVSTSPMVIAQVRRFYQSGQGVQDKARMGLHLIWKMERRVGKAAENR